MNSNSNGVVVTRHVDDFIKNIDISPFLNSRIQSRCGTSTVRPTESRSNQQDDVAASSLNITSHVLSSSTANSSTVTTTTPRQSSSSSSPFILYLPTVNLRKDQNPAFALACHIANHLKLPLLVLVVLLDDHSMPLSSPFCTMNHARHPQRTNTSNFNQVTMTARRLAFLTEALTQCTSAWSNHGAGVAIRVHRPNGGRMADHLTLSSRATTVVTDEPFVHPFVSFVHKVERVCDMNSIPCYRVDGSTTVPPCSILKKRHQVINRQNNCNENHGRSSVCKESSIDDRVYYDGVPAKAWMWQKRTEHLRQNQIQAAMNGDFDAPELECKIENDDFFIAQNSINDEDIAGSNRNHNFNSKTFPLHWRNRQNEPPGVRPWTVSELNEISNIKEWATKWPGSDASVPPCSQTTGTSKAGMQRWNNWISERKGLIYYARRRTDPLQPHASSRMSCYLNFGIVSIFRLVHEVKTAQNQKVSGADKFEEEIIKWREMSYAHSFSRGDYFTSKVVPRWAKKWLTERNALNGSSSSNSKVYGLSCLASGNSGNESWDGMQQYLVSTGELHNNVRMTWGKMLVHWNHVNNLRANEDTINDNTALENLMQILCYLNDRYALDGLSPPSYAGLLWCIGWSDKPDRNGGISVKRKYKLPGHKFKDAEDILMNDKLRGRIEQTTIMSSFSRVSTPSKKTFRFREEVNDTRDDSEEFSSAMKKPKTITLHQFFQSNCREGEED